MSQRQIDEWRDELDHAENAGRVGFPVGYGVGLVAATAAWVVAVALVVKRWR